MGFLPSDSDLNVRSGRCKLVPIVAPEFLTKNHLLRVFVPELSDIVHFAFPKSRAQSSKRPGACSLNFAGKPSKGSQREIPTTQRL
jgi:hypothetical protein